MLKNESGSMLVYSLVVSTVIFLGAFFLSSLQPEMSKLQTKHSKDIRGRYLVHSILDYSVYAIQNRWCLDESFKRTIGKCDYFHKRNTERLILQGATKEAFNKQIKSINQDGSKNLPYLSNLNKIKLRVRSIDRDHPLYKAIEQFRVSYPSFKDFVLTLKREQNNEYLPGSSAGHVWVSIKVILKFSSRPDMIGTSLVSFTPRKLSFFPLVLAGSLDLSNSCNEHEKDKSCLADRAKMNFFSPIILHKSLKLSNRRGKVTFYDKVVFDNSPDAHVARNAVDGNTIKVRGIHKNNSNYINSILTEGFLQDSYLDKGLAFLNDCATNPPGMNQACPNTSSEINPELAEKCREYYNTKNELNKLEKTKDSNLLVMEDESRDPSTKKITQGFYFTLSQNNTFKAMSEKNEDKKASTEANLKEDFCKDTPYKEWAWIDLEIAGQHKTLPICTKWEPGDIEIKLEETPSPPPPVNAITTTYYMRPTISLIPVLNKGDDKKRIRSDTVYLDLVIKFIKKEDNAGTETETELELADIQNIKTISDASIKIKVKAYEFGVSDKNKNAREDTDKGACFSNLAQIFLREKSSSWKFSYYETGLSELSIFTVNNWRITDPYIMKQARSPIERKCNSTHKELYQSSWKAPKITQSTLLSGEINISDTNWIDLESKCSSTLHVSEDVWVKDYSSETLAAWNFEPPISQYTGGPLPTKGAKDASFTIGGGGGVQSLVGNCSIKKDVDEVVGFYFCAKSLTIKKRDKNLRIIGSIITPKLIVEKGDYKVSWHSIYHPWAIKRLKQGNYISCTLPNQPPWHPEAGIPDLAKWKKCSPNALPGANSPFSWTTLDPDTIQVSPDGSREALERPRRFWVTEYGRTVEVKNK